MLTVWQRSKSSGESKLQYVYTQTQKEGLQERLNKTRHYVLVVSNNSDKYYARICLKDGIHYIVATTLEGWFRLSPYLEGLKKVTFDAVNSIGDIRCFRETMHHNVAVLDATEISELVNYGVGVQYEIVNMVVSKEGGD